MNERFAGYVQSVAFNMTLSRNMIEALGLIRDTGWIHNGTGNIPVSRYVDGHSVPIARALERRGLVEHWSCFYSTEEHDRKKIRWCYRLTRAGELMCELLVEAGLLENITMKRKRVA